MIGRSKPEKPYSEFPLFAHANGSWAKKIRGQLHYFGPWSDWQAALDHYQRDRDDLHAGRQPRQNAVTLGDALNQFLSSKKQLELSGELTPRSYSDYEKTCDRIADSMRANTPLASIHVSHFDKLRADLQKGKTGKLAAGTLKGELTRARCAFLFANEFCGVSLPYRKPLRAPKASEFRKIANKRGPRLFTRKEVRALIDNARLPLRAMILLGINCGFGNSDCGTLPFSRLELEKGWHHYARPKTHNQRRCPLWPETVAAIKAAIAERPESDLPLVFVTSAGQCWSKMKGDNALSSEFRKLCQSLGIYRRNVTTFYSLRRTFETIGAACGEQVAVDHIMGHLDQSMATVYRQKTFDGPLLKVSNHVRDWMLGRISLD